MQCGAQHTALWRASAQSGDRGEMGTKFTVGNLLECPLSRKG